MNDNDSILEGTLFFLVTLGCFRNEVESDLLRSAMIDLGMCETREPLLCDVAVVNTCGFIKDACDEAIDTILELDEALAGVEARPPLLVVGCMAERYPGLVDAMPEVQGLLGAGWSADIEEALLRLLSGGTFAGGKRRGAARAGGRAVDSSAGTSLFVRVADGCARGCAFCTIPSIRGPYRSRPIAEVTSEVKKLSRGEPREVVLLAQDLSYYGTDKGAPALNELIESLSELDDVHWLRLLYLQPEGVTDALVEAVASNDKVCNYFDIPFQHSSSKVLELMGRPGGAERFLELIGGIRRAIPDASLRTTLMVGYPGETDEDFEQLLAFIRAARFDWMGAFVYSPEEGTRAAGLRGAVPPDRAAERYNELLSVQEEIEESRSGAMTGRVLEVAVDGPGEPGEPGSRARSYREAPVVDGVVYLEGSSESKGFFRARITGREGLDLVATIEN